MSKQSGIYKKNDSDVGVVLRMSSKLHAFLEIEAQNNFRSLPMQIVAMLDKERHTDKNQRIESILSRKKGLPRISKEDKSDNKPLYTEDELNDIYKESRKE